ncbi:DUF4271 domain-containing protein [Pseudarcicella hirudinis]|uniref:DUF4271 domain-containing protein n=1 Tax=Pseudarcicella hirudinis TaxID=1079859 RepID=UPI000B825285|nr:DUF4271 domain-containing protein [Pseudarcicella hirudinis]
MSKIAIFLRYFFQNKPVGTSNSHRFLVLKLSVILLISVFSVERISAKGVGPAEGYYLVHDYHDDWQIYDEGYKAYVPYVRERHQEYSSFSLFFDFENYKGYKLLFYSKKENYLFIDASLQKKLPADVWTIMDVDSLQKVYRKTRLFLTFYGINTNAEDLKVIVGNKISKTERSIELTEYQLTVRPKAIPVFNNFFVLGLVFLLICYAFLYNFQPKTFERYYNFQDLLTINVRDDSFVNKPFDLGNLLFVINLSFTLAYLFMIIRNEETDLFNVSNILNEEETVLGLFLNFIAIAILIFIALIIKYLSLAILSNLYRFDNVTNVHFFKIMQASSIFFLLVLFLVSYSAISYPFILQNFEKYLLIPVVIFFILRLLLIYFTINKLTSLKNLYLFSYLCIVELIPVIIGIRFAL